MGAQQPVTVHDKSRRAVAALERLLQDKLFLDRRMLQPFDRGDTLRIRLYCEHQAGLHREPVQDDGAGAAVPVLAAGLAPG